MSTAEKHNVIKGTQRPCIVKPIQSTAKIEIQTCNFPQGGFPEALKHFRESVQFFDDLDFIVR